MRKETLIIPLIVIFLTSFGGMYNTQEDISQESLVIKHCQDFDINGKGDNKNWELASWTELEQGNRTKQTFNTKFKILYSEAGIYVLAHCEDSLIATDYQIDQGDIWEGDVFEIFLQPDKENPLYFEYEVNPLNTELVLLVPNNKGDFFGWAPWHYEGDRKVKRAVSIEGGNQESGAKIKSWTAEIFIPFTLFKGFINAPPKSGTEWKGNFYRMDYDTGEREIWYWKPIQINFHQYENYGRLIFE